MNRETFVQSARYIAARNLTDNVVAVTASFDALSGHLLVSYYTLGEPTEDDEEWCDITYAELSSAFPEILSARTCCARLGERTPERGDLVYER